MNALTESARTLLPRAQGRSYRERFLRLVTTDKQGVTKGVKSSWGDTSQPKTFLPPQPKPYPAKSHTSPHSGRLTMLVSPPTPRPPPPKAVPHPTRGRLTMLVFHPTPRLPPPSTPSPSAQALLRPKPYFHPTRGRLTMLVPHVPPRLPPPSATSSAPPYTILYIEGSPYPITEYPPYINRVDEA